MTAPDESPSEWRPLLVDAFLSPSNDSALYLRKKDKNLAIIACFLIILVNAWLATLMATPVLRLFEASVCRDYYLEHSPSSVDAGGYVPEELCKLIPIQEEVLFLNTSIAVLTSMICLSLHFPTFLELFCALVR